VSYSTTLPISRHRGLQHDWEKKVHEKQATYHQLVNDEIDAERKAKMVSDSIRSRYHVDNDGTVRGLPSDADLRLAAHSWARVHELRAKRYATIGVKVPAEAVKMVAGIARIW
jgi:hypothetical protein